MKFRDKLVNREHRFSIGIEEDSGKCYLSIPVSNGLVDYEEYYEINHDTFDKFQANLDQAANFAEECRRRLMDDRLIQKPGSNRGTPA